jgi:hypothetical protein
MKVYKTSVVYVRPTDGVSVIRHRSVHASSPEKALSFVQNQIERQYDVPITFLTYGSKAVTW